MKIQMRMQNHTQEDTVKEQERILLHWDDLADAAHAFDAHISLTD